MKKSGEIARRQPGAGGAGDGELLGAARGAHIAVTLYGIIAATGPAIRPDVQEVIMVSWTVVLVSLFLFHG